MLTKRIIVPIIINAYCGSKKDTINFSIVAYNANIENTIDLVVATATHQLSSTRT